MNESGEKVGELFERAVRLHHGGKVAEAQPLYRKILEVEPGQAKVLYLLGASCLQLGEVGEAIALLRQSVGVEPGYADAYATLGEAFLKKGAFAEAAGCFERALLLEPKLASARINLGDALQRMGRKEEGLAAVEKAAAMHASSAEAQFNFGNALRENGRLDEAIASYERALMLRSDYAEAASNLGVVLVACGRVEEAIASLRRAIALRPENAALHSGLLFILHFQAGHTAESIAQELATWRERHVDSVARMAGVSAGEGIGGRRLRVGYVSPDFREHCQAFFMVPLLTNHDRARVEVICYSDVRTPDAMTARLRGLAEGWRETSGMSDVQLAELIRADGIDVLVDLTMHMGGNRMLVFARKPAPVQVTWLAYPGSTGVPAIDYRMSDSWLEPVGMGETSAEKIYRLPDAFWCYDPLTEEPGVNALPAGKMGHVTFGCLNNFCKVNEGMVRLWSGVLEAVPGSRLLLLAPEGKSRERVSDMFLGCAINPTRVGFISPRARADYLRVYQRIDIALDTFPYNGHTTSLDAFWMGVPVVTLVGEMVVGRAGLCQLRNLGLPELIAERPEAYVRIAAGLAKDLARLGELRGSLRERLRASPLMDGKRFALNMEEAYRVMWEASRASIAPS